ncbi:MAG: ribonuclease HII [Bacilli bacterium]
MFNIFAIEESLHKQGYNLIAGCDEVGRGPMAGPLVASAVILDPNNQIEGLNDSKVLSKAKRDLLYQEIMSKAIEVQTVFIDVSEVDKLNVYQASKKAMTSCILNMKSKVDYVLTDAMKLDIDIPYEAIIKGDKKSAAIAAASIIAKVSRDQYMTELDKKYPLYGFKNHMGYVTKRHLLAIKEHGVSVHHRRSFKPVMDVLNNNI